MFENMYFYRTYLIKTKMLSMLCTLYFLKIAKISSRKHKIRQSAKIEFRATRYYRTVICAVFIPQTGIPILSMAINFVNVSDYLRHR